MRDFDQRLNNVTGTVAFRVILSLFTFSSITSQVYAACRLTMGRCVQSLNLINACVCTHDKVRSSGKFSFLGSRIWHSVRYNTANSQLEYSHVLFNFFSFACLVSASCLVLAFSFSLPALSKACATFAHCRLFTVPWTASDNFCEAKPQYRLTRPCWPWMCVSLNFS